MIVWELHLGCLTATALLKLCGAKRLNRRAHYNAGQNQNQLLPHEEIAGLLQAPKNARVCYVLAHGAGAGMSHPFMASVADGLAQRGIATLRYQFPYMEQGSKRPDAPKLAQGTVRAAVAQASHLLPKLDLVAGGKSFGGRMTSQAQPNSRCSESKASHSSGSRCTPLEGRQRSAEHTSLT